MAGTRGLNAHKAFAPWIEVAGADLPNPWRPTWTVDLGVPEAEEEEEEEAGETSQGADAAEQAWSVRQTPRARMRVCFDNLTDTLVHTIASYANGGVVVGCVAWLSEPRIMSALSYHCRGVLLLVNDEDYSSWGRRRGSVGPTMAQQYALLPAPRVTPGALFADMPSSPLSVLTDVNHHHYEAVRACGYPGVLMHSKYLVFFDGIPDVAGSASVGRPRAVWTGSMNFTRHASSNQENALFIECPNVAEMFFHDFANSFLVSKPIRGHPATVAT